jgi:hypothetical protein
MFEPTEMIFERALGILQDIPEMRDSPMLTEPFSRAMLKPSDRWMVVSRSESLAVGGFFCLFPSLSLAAPHILGSAGNIIGMWNLFDGEDYGRKRIPLVSGGVRCGEVPQDPRVETFSFSCPGTERPSSFTRSRGERPPNIEERAARLCDDVSSWSVDCVDRFCVITFDMRVGGKVSFANFHPSLDGACLEACRSRSQVSGIHDLFSDAWGFHLDIGIDGAIVVDGMRGSFRWSHSRATVSLNTNVEEEC